MSRKIKISPFALKVYKAVLDIPFGEVRTYKWVAKKIGHPTAFRAVGLVLKNNPLPLVIPCHRVIKSNGQLGGYTLGKKTKQLLLKIERQMKKLML